MFVGGIGRSGSTLIERLLGAMPGVCPAGEVVHLWRRGLVDDEACGCGVPFSRCPFWSEVGASAFGGWERLDARSVLDLQAHVDRTRYLPRLLREGPADRADGDWRRYTDLYHRLYGAIAARTGCRVIIDASKHASLAACLSWRYDIAVRVVHVVRDPRAVAHSWLKRVPRVQATPSSLEPEMARRSCATTAVHWLAQNAAFTALARRGVPTWLLRYEDFARSPRQSFAAVAAFAGCTGPSPFAGPRTVRLDGSHALSGNPMRAARGELQVHPDETWRQELRPAARAVVSALTAPLRSRYGYN